MKFKHILSDEKLATAHAAYTQRVKELLDEELNAITQKLQPHFTGLQIKLSLKQMYNDEGLYQGVLHFVAKNQSSTVVDAYRYFEEDYASYEWSASIDDSLGSLTAMTLGETLNEQVDEIVDLYKVLTTQQVLFSQDY